MNAAQLKTGAFVAASLIMVLLAAAIWTLGIVATTPPLTDDEGSTIPGSIATLERMELGGMDQWLLIRGEDVTNPVLLWLHGGPGGAQMPFAHHTDSILEQHFVVVHWDQRGAGKSNHSGFDERSMQVGRFVDDARELTEHLRERFGRDRIVLLGHSWGTQLAIQLIAQHPEYFSTYIGVSQTVNHDRATAIASRWLHERIDPAQAPEDWRALQAIPIPARHHSDYRALNRLVDRYGGGLDQSMFALARIAVRAPEYTAIDYLRLLRGMNRGGRPLHTGGVMAGYDHIAQFPAVQVPVYFLSGVNDYNTPLELVREYYAMLQAPHKALLEFEHSAHLPFLTEPQRFVAEIIRIAAQ